jgi:hypothetical protein
MSIWKKLFGATKASQTTSKTLLLEGTEFPFFTQEEPFFQSCVTSGQGALKIAFVEFWQVTGRGYKRKTIGGGTRLLCARCFMDMPFSFQMSLPGGMGGGSMIAIGEGLPSNLFGSAKKASCPWCSSPDGILLWDYAPLGDLAEQDMAALRRLWHERCLLWWEQNSRGEGLCDRCGLQTIPRGEGYHRGSEVICEQCARKCTDAEALAELRKKPDYFGTSELRRARNVAAGRWRFEKGRLI